MQEKDIKEFDGLIRSMLEDAEEKPSPRVWTAVSARVFGAPAAGTWSGWAWAGAAMAAALLALGVFLKPFSSHIPQMDPAAVQIIEQGSNVADLMLPETEDLRAEGETPSEFAAAPVTSAPRAAKTIVRTEVAQESVPVAQEVAPLAEEQVSEEAAQAPAPAESSPKAATGKAEEAQPQDYAYAFTDEEESFKAVPVSVSMHGALAGNGSDFNMPVYRQNLAPGALTGPKTTITELGDSSYGLPFTAGIGVRLYFLPRLSFSTGLDYSMVSRKFDGEYTKVGESGLVEVQAKGSVSHKLQYLGIPLNLYFDALTTNAFSFYLYGGGEAEFCVANDYILRADQEYRYSKSVDRIQWSTTVGVGVQFQLSRYLGIYLDPGLRYYFNCDQPKNVRTEHPLMFNLNAGLRINL